MGKMKMVSVTDLKKSTAAVLREARESGQTLAIVKNNQIEGYYTPVGLLEIERATRHSDRGSQYASGDLQALLEYSFGKSHAHSTIERSGR